MPLGEQDLNRTLEQCLDYLLVREFGCEVHKKVDEINGFTIEVWKDGKKLKSQSLNPNMQSAYEELLSQLIGEALIVETKEA